MNNADLFLSSVGEELIKEFEGYRNTAYKDAVGVWTIGWGHTRTARQGMVVRREQAQTLFGEDIAVYERGVREAVKVPLNQNEFDALVSFAYNVGVSAMRGSTLVRLLNARIDRSLVAQQFSRWSYAGGKLLDGLLRRRERERDLFLTPPVNGTKLTFLDNAHERPSAPDGPQCDMPMLSAPFHDTMATRLLCTLCSAPIERAFGVDIALAASLDEEELNDMDTLVRAAQDEAGLLVDGVAGPDTWLALFSRAASVSAREAGHDE
jgi:lysozyme